jgi:hypothetical protein
MTEEKRAGKLALLMSKAISTGTIQMESHNNTG